VAASVGPYGAYLADGSEYSGAYAIGRKCLAAFHRKRWAILADAQPDVMACETVPSLDEALALAELSAEYPATPTWISFSCRDDAHISDGTPLAACARQLDAFPTVAGIGINCTAPALIPALLRRLKAATDKVIVVYPNSGEQFDALRKCWVGVADSAEFATQAAEWHALGADIIGGCCRTTPRHIAAVRRRLLTS
jgi:homocysteine S-methyltransferase